MAKVFLGVGHGGSDPGAVGILSLLTSVAGLPEVKNGTEGA